MDSINDILSSLTPDDIESLKSMAENLFGSESENNGKKSRENTSDNMGFDNLLNPEMIFKISSLMNMMNNSQHGERYKLIEALKPNLSSRRREKADEAMKIMKIFEILPVISELFKGGDINAKL